MKYQIEIEDMVRRRVARKLTNKEIQEYNGPIHYIHHHEVLKPESSSTPVRIVFNSSASYMGQRLKDFWAKGPDILNSLLGVLCRFRQDNIAIVGDIAKMYHTVKLSTLDEHTHRFVWRDLDDSRPPDQYVLTTVTFGDRPSGTIAMVALSHTVEQFKISTRRKILSQIASLYDPLGLVIPVLLKAKILMRSMISKRNSNGGGIKWDDPLDNSMMNEWKAFFKELYGLESLTFRRPLKPSNAFGKPNLVIFSDGSTQAYGACAYVRWQISDNKFESTLIMVKLCGALIAARMRELIVKEFSWEFESVYHIVDSTIVRSQIQKESHGFNTFVAVRIAEIQIKTDSREWWWVDSIQNVADMTSKPCSPEKIGENSAWQNGPKFLTLPISKWPIKQNCEIELTDRVGVVMAVAKVSQNHVIHMVDVNRFSDYYKLLRVTCRVMNVFKCRSFKGMQRTNSSRNY
ncbi:uncharacterized protein [Palaemon carinicauda]|uniref:uncharacterized protein n=1 Tax=Palaemon carinicauda TaxID=392227 RepID=UPI0035B60AF1